MHACSTNTTKSGELHDNETKNESNDNDSVHIYFMDSPIRMGHEEIGKKDLRRATQILLILEVSYPGTPNI